MKSVLALLILLLSANAFAEFIFPNVGTNPPKPNPTPAPTPQVPWVPQPTNCAAGLPVGQAPKRTERDLGKGTKEITYESYHNLTDRIEHRIQTGKITDVVQLTNPFMYADFYTPNLYSITCNHRSDVLTKVKVRTMPLWSNCAWSNWAERVEADTKSVFDGFYSQDLITKEAHQTTSEKQVVIGLSASTKGSQARKTWSHYFNGQLSSIWVEYSEPNGKLEIAGIGFYNGSNRTSCDWNKTENGKQTVYVNDPMCHLPGVDHRNNYQRVYSQLGTIDRDTACEAAIKRDGRWPRK